MTETVIILVALVIVVGLFCFLFLPELQERRGQKLKVSPDRAERSSEQFRAQRYAEQTSGQWERLSRRLDDIAQGQSAFERAQRGLVNDVTEELLSMVKSLRTAIMELQTRDAGDSHRSIRGSFQHGGDFSAGPSLPEEPPMTAVPRWPPAIDSPQRSIRSDVGPERPRTSDEARDILRDMWNGLDWNLMPSRLRTSDEIRHFIDRLGGELEEGLRDTYALVQLPGEGSEPARLFLFPYLRRDKGYYSSDFFELANATGASGRLIQPAEVTVRLTLDLSDAIDRLRSMAKLSEVFEVKVKGVLE